MDNILHCALCGTRILESTAKLHSGFCAHCAKLPARIRRVRQLVTSGLDPVRYAVRLYEAEIRTAIWKGPVKFFGAVGDPMFESARLYSAENLSRSLSPDQLSELGEDSINAAEDFLAAAEADTSLLLPLAEIFRSIAPFLNSLGCTVFLASWGMAPAEIGWLVRHFNSRTLFDAYLRSSGLQESEVDQYNEAYLGLIDPSKNNL